LRLGCDDTDVDSAEKVIAHASGIERDTILALPDIFAQQLAYGLGGEFCYWRSLLYKFEGRLKEAEADAVLYRRCLGEQ